MSAKKPEAAAENPDSSKMGKLLPMMPQEPTKKGLEKRKDKKRDRKPRRSAESPRDSEMDATVTDHPASKAFDGDGTISESETATFLKPVVSKEIHELCSATKKKLEPAEPDVEMLLNGSIPGISEPADENQQSLESTPEEPSIYRKWKLTLEVNEERLKNIRHVVENLETGLITEDDAAPIHSDLSEIIQNATKCKVLLDPVWQLHSAHSTNGKRQRAKELVEKAVAQKDLATAMIEQLKIKLVSTAEANDFLEGKIPSTKPPAPIEVNENSVDPAHQSEMILRARLEILRTQKTDPTVADLMKVLARAFFEQHDEIQRKMGRRFGYETMQQNFSLLETELAKSDETSKMLDQLRTTYHEITNEFLAQLQHARDKKNDELRSLNDYVNAGHMLPRFTPVQSDSVMYSRYLNAVKEGFEELATKFAETPVHFALPVLEDPSTFDTGEDDAVMAALDQEVARRETQTSMEPVEPPVDQSSPTAALAPDPEPPHPVSPEVLFPKPGRIFNGEEFLDENGAPKPHYPYFSEKLPDGTKVVLWTFKKQTTHPLDAGRQNQDRIVYIPDQKIFAVIDGMGLEKGINDGEIAAQVCADEFAKRSPLEAVETSRKRFQELIDTHELRPDAGVCLAAVQMDGDKGRAASMGDSRVMVVRDGEVVSETVDDLPNQSSLDDPKHSEYIFERQEHQNDLSKSTNEVVNPLRADWGTLIVDDLIGFEPGDMTLIVSDGWTKNFNSKTTAAMIKDKLPYEAMEIMQKEFLKEMLSGSGRPDDVSIIIIQQPEPVTEEIPVTVTTTPPPVPDVLSDLDMELGYLSFGEFEDAKTEKVLPSEPAGVFELVDDQKTQPPSQAELNAVTVEVTPPTAKPKKPSATLRLPTGALKKSLKTIGLTIGLVVGVKGAYEGFQFVTQLRERNSASFPAAKPEIPPTPQTVAPKSAEQLKHPSELFNPDGSQKESLGALIQITGAEGGKIQLTFLPEQQQILGLLDNQIKHWEVARKIVFHYEAPDGEDYYWVASYDPLAPGISTKPWARTTP